MDRANTLRRLLLFLAAGAWIFVLLSAGSFHSDDWPSHRVWPHPSPAHNLCGPIGAWIAYWLFFAVGHGVFPLLLFTGLCMALYLFGNRIGDLWLRAIGLLLLSISFAAAVHLIKPGSPGGLPEGNGGILGIGAAKFLHAHFSGTGSALLLVAAFFVGLLLAADELVVRGARSFGSAIRNVRQNGLPFGLPKLPRLITRDMLLPRPATAGAPATSAKPPLDDEPLKPPVLLRQNATSVADRPNAPDAPPDPLADGQQIDLDYEQEEPQAAQEKAFEDATDPKPSEPATVPPPDQQAVPAPPKPDIIVRLPNSIKPRQTAPPPPKELGEYHLPNWDLLADTEHGYAASQESFVREKAAVLEQSLREFNVDARVVEIDTGPVITMYELSLAAGTKVSAITALSNDIARALAATAVRIVAPVPGKHTVGIEVPNAQKEKVRLKELMQLAPEATRKMYIPLFLGKDASGEPLVTDLAAMPHCLIAGTTGSGKSVCINTIIMSIMYTQRPDMVKLVLFDPKVVEMANFREIPHLMCPIINETPRAISVLEWACEKMDERYEVLAEAGVRNIAGYNKLTREELAERFKPSTPEEEARIPKHLPYIIIIVDELADLMMTSGKEVEASIVRLAQKSRAVGIHLVLATQRPQANVVTGLIKANMPSRIAFRVASKMDSRIVLDQNGADLLLGQGDMLFMPPGSSKPIRAQGTFVDDKEIRQSVGLLKNLAEAQYEPELVQIKAKSLGEGDLEKDDLFDDAVKVILETRRGSVSLLQRRLAIGYGRASRLIELMANAGILGEYKGTQARECVISLEDWEAMKAQQQTDQQAGMSV